jgi:chitin disaccharide deacetylase
VKRLIVNADDFGVTAGVNRAILELSGRGQLSSATMMAAANSTHEAATASRAQPRLGIGCHVVLVDGVPVLPPAKLPTLVETATGRFRPTLGNFVSDLLLGRIRASEIQAEAEAQVAHLRSLGLTLTHIDTHKHTHIFPGVAAPLLDAARHHRISAIRNPFEPDWSIRATRGAPFLRRTQVRILNRFRSRFMTLIAQSGLTTTDGAIGIVATGTLDLATLTSILHSVPEGIWELVTHPGYNDQALAASGTRLLTSRDEERSALSQVAMPADIQLINFGNLNTFEDLNAFGDLEANPRT